MRISAIGPVLNEVQFIGYSIMSGLDNFHEFIYALDASSSDGTRELLHHIKAKYAHEKLLILDCPTFHPSEMEKYNAAFDLCIKRSTGDAIMFYHPDMIVSRWNDPKPGPLAWWTNITSYAGDFSTVITKGRADKWKNIHAKKFGLTYCGGYGSQNEDFYHTAITGKSLKHYGTEFYKYPFEVAPSGIDVSHFCELKPYKRRLEKMKFCLKTQNPDADKYWIEEKAVQHPRVTLEPSGTQFGTFEFTSTDKTIPAIVERYKAEFESFTKEKELVHHG